MTRHDDRDSPASAPASAPDPALPVPLAEIVDLRVEVGGRAIVDGVSLRVRPGRVTALVGASGSGKTTTGLALLGEFPAGAHVTGEVRMPLDGLVGYVPQHPAAVLNPARRISALLTDIARTRVRRLPRGERRAATRAHVLRALADAQLPDAEPLLRRFPHQLSGGQQQRVVLAQALLLGARVVVADEPTTGQDALTKSRVVEQLAAVAARGIAVVLLSHDLDVVRALADEVHVMRAGRVVESGPVERVWSAPRHEWTRQLLTLSAPHASIRPGPPPEHAEHPVEPVRPVRPAPPVEPVQPEPPVQLVQPVRPVRPVEPGRLVGPVQLDLPEQPNPPVGPVQPEPPVEPVEPVQRVQPVRPVQPVEPIRPVEPIQLDLPEQPNPPVEPVQPDLPNPPVEPDLPEPPVKPALPEPSEPPVVLVPPVLPGPPEPPVLCVRDLTARHRDGSSGTTAAVHAPELALCSGESLALVGRSGSGKTTLARCLAGLHRDHDGEILLDGTPLPRSLRDRGRGQLAAVQYVFQDARAAFDEHRPVLDQVARTAVRLRGVGAGAAEAEALTTLTRLGLPPDVVSRRPDRLSGGELQRAALARALLAHPRVLICDEITSGLDTVTRHGILDVLTGLLRGGTRPGPALLLITHDLETAAVADRIAVMDAGEIVEQGPARQLLTTPRHAFTASLVATRSNFTGRS